MGTTTNLALIQQHLQVSTCQFFSLLSGINVKSWALIGHIFKKGWGHTSFQTMHIPNEITLTV